MASIKAYKDGWRAQVYVNGKRDSQVFRTQREAKAWAAAREHQIRRHEGLAGTHTLREMLERYDSEIVASKRGVRAESLRLRAFLRNFPALASKRLSEITAPDLAAWRDVRLTEVSPASVQRDIGWLRAAFNLARREWCWLDSSPFEGVRPPPASAPRERRVYPSEVRALCRHLDYRTGHAPVTKHQEVALALLVALRTAMRAGEILSLGRRNLDLQRRVAMVDHKTQHITGKPRAVPLSRHAVRLLRPVAELDRCFTISSRVLDETFRQARKQLAVLTPSIADLHFHDSRAEALTRLSRKVDVMTLAKISGHRNISLLLNTYYRESAEHIAARL